MAYEHITPIACATAIVLTLASGSAWGQSLLPDCPKGQVRVWLTDVASECKEPITLATAPRTYTLDEIDRMRAAVSDDPLFKEVIADLAKRHPADFDVFYAEMVEQRLCTYLAAGISPEALEAKAKEGK